MARNTNRQALSWDERDIIRRAAGSTSQRDLAALFGLTVRGVQRIQRSSDTMPKRGYSRDFKPHGDTGKRYLLDSIPAGLWSAVKDKAKRQGVSLRALILHLLTEWVKE